MYFENGKIIIPFNAVSKIEKDFKPPGIEFKKGTIGIKIFYIGLPEFGNSTILFNTEAARFLAEYKKSFVN